MWIGVAVVLMLNGSFVTDASAFANEAECKSANNDLVAQVKAHAEVAAYHVECFKADKLVVK